MKDICKDEKGCSVNYFNKCCVLVVGLLALRRSLRSFIEELIDSQQIRMSRNGKRRVILFILLGTTASTWIFLIQKKDRKRRKTSQAQCCEPQPQSNENDLTQDTINEEHVEVEHSYSASCTRKCSMEMQRLSSEIKIMGEELNTLKLSVKKESL
uniref:Uncharacterized protein LOC111120453 n=1 Tax=Crassostrea virginica TaxID=6565 RepID=A0A8B8CNW0_CRAVI|nr:uncharacterized protein LOC111120453 [Crassostrea virginica]